MSKLSVGRKTGLLRGGFLLALFAVVMGLVVGCGEAGTPSGNGGFIPTTFTVSANLITAAGQV
ncbi:MAG: hypothetical protein M3Y56_08865, partial [Armatimonadota bacterium]|nr:hypothetical protein [Armatimonadota bacterium]